MVLVVAVLLLAAAGYMAAEVATSPERERRNLVRRAANYGRVRLLTGPDRLHFGERVVAPLNGWLAGWVLKLNPKESLEQINLKLMAAGMRNVTPSGLLGAKAMLGLGGVLFAFLLGASAGARSGFLAFLAFGAGGYFAPGFLVSARARKRADSIRAELPDALDLLAVSVEAGLGFDGAIAKLTEHMDGPLTDEFAQALGEMRIGESRENALKKMAERVASPELAAFVRAVVQADQLGTSLGRTLRIQAADSRLKRQAAAEEKAMKAPIKMLFPTVLFIFPAMFLVILGPALLSIKKVL